MRSRLFWIALTITTLTACGGGPYLKKSPDLTSAGTTQRALLTTAVVDANACKSGARVQAGSMGDKCGGGLASVFQSGQLDDFGATMLARTTAFLAANGLELYVDPAHAKKINMELVKGASKSMAGMNQAMGLWVSPDTSNVRIPGRPPMALYKHIFRKLDTPASGEAFVFVEGRISKKSAWFGFWKKPRVEIDIGVYTEDAQPLLQTRVVGYGDGSFLFVDQSAKNLERAMVRGLDRLAQEQDAVLAPTRVAQAEPEPLAPVGTTPPDANAAAPPEEVPPSPSDARPADEPPPRSLADRPADGVPRSLADRPSSAAPPSSAEPAAPSATAAREVQTERTPRARPLPRHRLGGGLLLGLGGSLSPVLTRDEKDLLPDDYEVPRLKLDTSSGGFLQYTFMASPYFSAGVRAELFSWITAAEAEAEVKRDLVLNLSPTIRGALPIGPSLFYLAAHLGPSLTMPSSERDTALVELNARATYHTGLGVGIELLGHSDRPSLFMEVGYRGQHVRYGTTTTSGSEQDPFRARFWQVGLNIGATYGF